MSMGLVRRFHSIIVVATIVNIFRSTFGSFLRQFRFLLFFFVFSQHNSVIWKRGNRIGIGEMEDEKIGIGETRAENRDMGDEG